LKIIGSIWLEDIADMSEAKSSVSKAASYQEIGEYWDEHDLAEVWEKTEPVTLEVDLRTSVTYHQVEGTQ
jgi:hypothetical protein